MKIYFNATLATLTCLTAAVIATGCAQNSNNIPAQVTTTSTYSINNVLTQGVDDSGNMYLDIQGQFPSPPFDSVVVSCTDVFGNTDNLTPGIISQTTTDAIVTLPAASYYPSCQITVNSGSLGINATATAIFAMDITQTPIATHNGAGFSVEIDGDFYNQTPNNSNYIVSAQCVVDGTPNSTTTTVTHPAITSQNGNQFDVNISNPGVGHYKKCQFWIEDTYTDTGDNNVTVFSQTSDIVDMTGY